MAVETLFDRVQNPDMRVGRAHVGRAHSNAGRYVLELKLFFTPFPCLSHSTFICFLLGVPIGSYTGHPWEIRHVYQASCQERKALSSSDYSSLPPCSEMILQEVLLRLTSYVITVRPVFQQLLKDPSPVCQHLR